MFIFPSFTWQIEFEHCELRVKYSPSRSPFPFPLPLALLFPLPSPSSSTLPSSFPPPPTSLTLCSFRWRMCAVGTAPWIVKFDFIKFSAISDVEIASFKSHKRGFASGLCRVNEWCPSSHQKIFTLVAPQCHQLHESYRLWLVRGR